jgi:hypothetical protein
MKETSHRDDLEEYLKQQASEHRMYPSDHVWRNIRKKIHTPIKWPALSVLTVLTISALVIGTVLNKPVPDTVTANFHFSLQSPANIVAEKAPADVKSIQTNVADEHYSVERLTSNTITAAVEKIQMDNAVRIQLAQTVKIPDAYFASASNTPSAVTKVTTQKSEDIVAVQNKTPLSGNTLSNINYYLFDVESRLRSILNAGPSQNTAGGVAFFQSGNNLSYHGFDIDLKVGSEYKELLPQALEQLSKNSSRFDFRFYITPSVSYRHLHEQKQNVQQQVNTVSLESSYKVKPSEAIHQSPAIGYETGFGLGYALNKRFTLTGGFQFNISQYKIDAFLYKDEPVALTLDEGNFSSTVNTVSSLRSIPGSEPITIKNRYYQISIPIGIEWLAWNNDKFSWGLAGALQPSYTFDKQPLIISSNFKNYADGSEYVRNLNLNANLESFFGYTIGSYRWQIGPQVRYQMLPSLVDKYPNREYLINYGLKIGVVKKLK